MFYCYKTAAQHFAKLKGARNEVGWRAMLPGLPGSPLSDKE